MKPAIVLSTHTMGLGVIRSLGMMGVPIIAMYYDSRDMGFCSRYVRERIPVPHPEQQEDQFLDLLIALGHRLGDSILLPVSDAALSTLSRHKIILQEHYTVACTDWGITERFIDKKLTYDIAEKAGVSVPHTITPHSIEDIEAYAHLLQYPCLVKPSQSHRYVALFKKKMVQVDTLDQLLTAYRQAEAAGIEVMIQELIPGPDNHVVNYNAYFADDIALVEFTSEHTRNAPPIFGSPRVAQSKPIPEIITPGRETLRALGFYGYACTEFKRDARDGTYKLMEVNGRHNLSTLLAVSCGINFPWLHYRHLMYGEVPSATTYQAGIYWIDLERDIAHSFNHYTMEKYAFREYTFPYLSPHVFAIFDWRDPQPFLKRCKDLVQSVWQKFVHSQAGVPAMLYLRRPRHRKSPTPDSSSNRLGQSTVMSHSLIEYEQHSDQKR